MSTNSHSTMVARKYAPTLLNAILRITGANKVKNIGPVAEMYRELEDKGNFKAYHQERYPTAVADGANKMMAVIEVMIETLQSLTREDCANFIEDLIYEKTPKSMAIEVSILKAIAKSKNLKYTKPTKKQEANGIDGIIDGVTYQVKPYSFKTNSHYLDRIDANYIVFYRSETEYEIELNPVRGRS